jgi:hypothetical protein
MSNSIPVLPPIKQKRHRLNIEKAQNRLYENYLSSHDTGATSITYRITEHSEVKIFIELYHNNLLNPFKYLI